MLILRIAYLHTHASFPLVSGQGKYILAFFELYIMCARLSLYSPFFALFLPWLSRVEKEVFTLLNPYTVYFERFLFWNYKGDSLNSHVYTKMFEARCLEAIIDRNDPHIIQFICLFISAESYFEVLA